MTLLVRRGELSASRVLQEKVLRHPRVALRYNTVVREFRGEHKLHSVLVWDVLTGVEEELTPGGVFVFTGLEPNSDFVRGVLELDAAGFIVTGPTLETSMAGVFAAGDVRSGSTKQVASAAGEGAAAALMIRRYLHQPWEVNPA